MRIRNVLLLLTIATMLGGCGQRKETRGPAQSVDERKNADPWARLTEDVRQLKEAGLFEDLIQRLEGAMADPELGERRETVFSFMMQECLNAGMTNKAAAAYMKAIDDKETNLVEMAAGMVGRAYVRNKHYEQAIEWGDSLLKKDIPSGAVMQSLQVLVTSYVFSDRESEIASRLPAIMAMEDRHKITPLLRSTGSLLRRAGKHDTLEAILTVLEEEHADIAWVTTFAILTRCDSLLDRRMWDDSEKLLMGKADVLSDDEISARMRRLASGLDKNGRVDDVNRICRNAIKNMEEFPRTGAAMGALWIILAAKDADAFLERVSEVIDEGIATSGIASAFEGGFYDLMSKGSVEQKKRCRELGEKFRSILPENKSLTARLTLLELDAAFYQKDFRKAHDIVSKGVENMDEEWHSVILNKINAHLALSENRTLEAIEYFRKHMARVEQWERPQRNPENDLLMLKEAVLGFNEKRIGDIFKSMGRTKDADRAYLKAREYYEKALTLVENDSREYAEYMNELAAVPDLSEAKK